MIAAASASAGSLTRRLSSEVLPAPRKPGNSVVTEWIRPGPAGAAWRSFHLRALIGRRGDGHRRRLRRRLLGLRRSSITGCGRGPAVLGGVLACLGLWFWCGILGGGCGRRRRCAVLAAILCRR